MAKLICTMWALLLNTLGISIFQTCFANSIEDEDGEPMLSGPPVTSFLFAVGVYTVIVKFDLFPQSLREPNPAVKLLYEFLVTAFMLEFAIACIWTPVDILIVTTIPKMICKILCLAGMSESGETVVNKYPMALLSYSVALAFLFLALHVTRSVDFTVLTECGSTEFLKHVKSQLIMRIQSELPGRRIRCNRKGCRCRTNCIQCRSRNSH